MVTKILTSLQSLTGRYWKLKHPPYLLRIFPSHKLAIQSELLVIKNLILNFQRRLIATILLPPWSCSIYHYNQNLFHYPVFNDSFRAVICASHEYCCNTIFEFLLLRLFCLVCIVSNLSTGRKSEAGRAHYPIVRPREFGTVVYELSLGAFSLRDPLIGALPRAGVRPVGLESLCAARFRSLCCLRLQPKEVNSI